MDALLDTIRGMNPIVAALVATTFTWLLTAAGASLVFFIVKMNQKILDGLLGFTAGVMIAASFWSLLAPAIEMSETGSASVQFQTAGGQAQVVNLELDGSGWKVDIDSTTMVYLEANPQTANSLSPRDHSGTKIDESPERIAHEFLAAMHAGNYRWAEKLINAKSRLKLEALEAQHPQGYGKADFVIGETSESTSNPWLPPAIGFMLGAFFLYGIDKILPHLHIGFKTSEAEGIKTTWHRSVLLILAITLHNIPEGLAVGVAFGAAAIVQDPVLADTLLLGAITLGIGIGLQNFPEGMAVAMPLRREGLSRFKSFWYGQLSAIVEPVAGVIGAALVIMMQPILPYALSFAAGAMIFVVVEEVVPESHREGNHDIATMGAMIGFTVMMVLDVSLG